MSSTCVAVQLYTLRDFLKTPEEIATTLAKVSKLGFRAVQLSGLGPIDLPELKRILDGEGLTVCANHTRWERLVNEPEQVLADHALLGCDFTAVPVAPEEYRSGEGYARFARELSEIARRMKEQGLKVGYHNHSFEFERFDGRTGMEILVAGSDPAAVFLELDTYWIQHGGSNPITWIRESKGRVHDVHFKDMGVVDNQQVMAEVGEGNLDWPGILEACREIGVRWYIIEQDTCRRDPFESLAISLRNVNGWGLQ